MPRTRTTFVCQECGAHSPKWLGRCAECGAWNSLVEERAAEAAAGVASAHRYALAGSSGVAQLYADIQLEQHARLSTGIDEFDRVLGGGVVPGSLVLLGGEPGIGKSSLVAQVAARVAARGPVLYVTGEESPAQVKLRARRLGADAADIRLLAETDVDAVIEQIRRLRPVLVVVDSIQTMSSEDIGSAAGSV